MNPVHRRSLSRRIAPCRLSARGAAALLAALLLPSPAFAQARPVAREGLHLSAARGLPSLSRPPLQAPALMRQSPRPQKGTDALPSGFALPDASVLRTLNAALSSA